MLQYLYLKLIKNSELRYDKYLCYSYCFPNLLRCFLAFGQNGSEFFLSDEIISTSAFFMIKYYAIYNVTSLLPCFVHLGR